MEKTTIELTEQQLLLLDASVENSIAQCKHQLFVTDANCKTAVRLTHEQFLQLQNIIRENLLKF